MKDLISKAIESAIVPMALVRSDGVCLLKNDAYIAFLKENGCDDLIVLEYSIDGINIVPLFDGSGDPIAYFAHGLVENVSDATRHGTIKKHDDQFSVLNDLMASMLSYQKLDPLLQHIANVVTELTEANNALILLVDETEEYLDVAASAGSASAQNMGVRREYGSGFAGLAWSTKTNQYLANCDDNTMTKGFWPAKSQLVAVPLMSNEIVIGVAVLAAPSQHKSFRDSTGLVGHLASLAGIAIVNARSKEQSELELSRMRALREINSILGEIENPTKLIQAVSKTLMNAMDISRVVYYVVEDDGLIENTEIWVKEDGVITEGQSILDNIFGEGINGWCYKNNKPAYLPRHNQDTRESVNARAARRDAGIGSTFCVPITSMDRVVGVISISRDLSKRDLNENERNLFFSIVNQISSALLNIELSGALKHRAFHDSLTELPNRFCFERELNIELKSMNENQMGAVMFLDLDGFKSVNDSLGHHFGDKLLNCVAERFKSCLSQNDMIARIGGDEFAVIARNLNDKSQAVAIAERMINSLETSIDISGARVKIGTSVGLSYFPHHSDESETLIRNADEAMYRAKADGKGRAICFDQSMADDSQRRLLLENEMRDAIKTNQFVLYFQPQVDTYTGDVDSVESLIRWNHPTRGFVSPGEFIPIAEEAGLINSIGAWVIEQAIAQLAAWQDGPLGHIRIAVNIAASQFLLENFSETIIHLLAKHNVKPSLLEIEVTESIVMNEIKVVVSALDALRAAGVSVAVDDFGTGYSSLSYLQDLPLDILKIDRTFIERLENENVEQSVAYTITLLANGLGLKTVAEGVETEAQLRQVQKLGCNSIQGFYFSKPCAENKLADTIVAIRKQFEQTRFKMAS